MANGNSFMTGPVDGKPRLAWLWRRISAIPPGLVVVLAVVLTFYRA